MTAQKLCCLWFCVVFGGCQYTAPGVVGSGVMKREVREVQPFDRVSISGSANLDIKVGQSSQSCEVECDDNLLELLETKVEDGELKIGFVESISSSKLLQIWLKAEHLSKVSGSGSVSGKIEGLDEPELELDMSGSSKIQCDGKAEKLLVTGSGSTTFDCQTLVADDVTVAISGSGKADVHANRKLKVAISGSGTVRYSGSPELEKSIAGIGSVEKKVPGTVMVDHPTNPR